MSKPIALAFSDLHKHNWRAFNQKKDRLYYSLTPLGIIGVKAKKLGIPVLFTGDWEHTPKYVETLTNYEGFRYYKLYFEDLGVDLYAISGNHDFCEKNNKISPSPSHLDVYNLMFNHFHKLDWESVQTKHFSVSGIPYIDNNVGFEKAVQDARQQVKDITTFKILLIHTNLPKAVNNFGHMIKSVGDIDKNTDKFFKGWDLVLSGHIHKKQQLGKNVYMLGATSQQTRGDEGCNMGYWIIYKDRKPKFKKLNLPEFKEIIEGEDIPKDNNYYTVIPKEVISGLSNTKKQIRFENVTGINKLVKSYLKVENIKSKSKKRILVELLHKQD